MNRILVAYDGGDPARRALFAAAQIARAIHAEIGVISVVPLRFVGGRRTVDPWDDERVHRAELEEARRILQASGLEPELIEKVGEPAQEIEKAAEDEGYDAIFVGRRPLNLIERLLLGSVSERVAERSHATVVITP
jgi:nucleotide-binding universal stress UspA family protein